MKKWVTFGLVAMASLALTSLAVADVPDGATSTVDCYCTGHAGGGASGTLPYNCTIGPAGTSPSDVIHVDVVVNNILGNPLQNSNVTANAVAINSATAVWCSGENPQSQLSALDGSADFVFSKGTVNPVDPTPGTLTETLDFDVSAMGPGAGGPVGLAACDPALVVISYDLVNLDLSVGLPDFAKFAADFASDDVEADFNHDRASNPDEVGLADFALFASHFGDVCP